MLIFVLILALNIMMPRMIKWVNGSNSSGKNGSATTIISESSINNAGGILSAAADGMRCAEQIIKEITQHG